MKDDVIVADIKQIIELLITAKNEKRIKIVKVLNQVMKKADEIFEIVSEYQRQFVHHKGFQIDFYYDAQDKLSGCYMYLTPIAGVLDAIKTNRQEAYFVQKKLKINKDEKFNASAIRPEASQFVSEERLVRNIFQGYLDSCKQAIQTCRNRIERFEYEKHLNQE